MIESLPNYGGVLPAFFTGNLVEDTAIAPAGEMRSIDVADDKTVRAVITAPKKNQAYVLTLSARLTQSEYDQFMEIYELDEGQCYDFTIPQGLFRAAFMDAPSISMIESIYYNLSVPMVGYRLNASA